MIGKVIGMGDVEKPRLKREWIGRRVKTLEELRCGWGIISPGTVMEVLKNSGNRQLSGNWIGGLELQTADPCPCCGLKARISRVEESAVELLPVDAPAEGLRPVSTTDPELEACLQDLQQLTDANGLDLVLELRGAVVSQILYVRQQLEELKGAGR